MPTIPSSAQVLSSKIESMSVNVPPVIVPAPAEKETNKKIIKFEKHSLTVV